METIRRTEPMENVNPDLQGFFDRLLQDEMHHIHLLREAIVKQIASNAWK